MGFFICALSSPWPKCSRSPRPCKHDSSNSDFQVISLIESLNFLLQINTESLLECRLAVLDGRTTECIYMTAHPERNSPSIVALLSIAANVMDRQTARR